MPCRTARPPWYTPSMRTPGTEVARGRWDRSAVGWQLVGGARGRPGCCTCLLYRAWPSDHVARSRFHEHRQPEPSNCQALWIRRLGFESFQARAQTPPSTPTKQPFSKLRPARSPALLWASCRPCAEQHVSSAYRLGPFRFIPHPLLKRLHADFLGGGHSGAHD